MLFWMSLIAIGPNRMKSLRVIAWLKQVKWKRNQMTIKAMVRRQAGQRKSGRVRQGSALCEIRP